MKEFFLNITSTGVISAIVSAIITFIIAPIIVSRYRNNMMKETQAELEKFKNSIREQTLRDRQRREVDLAKYTKIQEIAKGVVKFAEEIRSYPDYYKNDMLEELLQKTRCLESEAPFLNEEIQKKLSRYISANQIFYNKLVENTFPSNGNKEMNAFNDNWSEERLNKAHNEVIEAAENSYFSYQEFRDFTRRVLIV